MVNEAATARVYLADRLFDVLIYRPGPTRGRNLAELLPDELALPAAFVESILDEDPRFVAAEGVYDIAYREQLPRRPLGGALDAVLSGYGRPMPKALLVSELVRTQKGDLAFFQDFVRGILAKQELSQLEKELVYLPQWLFVPMPGTDRDRLLYLNALTDDEDLAEVMDVCTQDKLGSRSLTETAYAVLDAAKRPLTNKALGFLVGCHQGEKYDPAELLRQMVYDHDKRFIPISGPRWTLADWAAGLRRSLRKQAPKAEEKTYEVDIEQVLAKEIPAGKAYVLSEEEKSNLLALVERAKAPFTIEQILADVLELTPNQRKYAPAAQAVCKLLDNTQGVKKLHIGRYLRLAAIPRSATTVPEALVPDEWQAETGKDGQLLSDDVILELEGLSPEAAEAAADPHYEDIGEFYVPQEPAAERPEAITYPVLYHHYLEGTIHLRATDVEFFAEEDSLTMVNFRHQKHDLLGVWLNKETRLIYGLAAWYQTHLPPSGALLTLVKGAAAGEYVLQYTDETDAQTYIGKETLQDLLGWREHFRHTPASLLEIVELLLEGDKGMPFNQLWAQLNVIRRTTRAQLASILSFYHRFEFGEGNRWYRRARKVAEGYDIQKLPHVVGFDYIPPETPEAKK